ncbi:DUF167 domain-containing protein [Sphingorhabdus sp.]|uniref:DUF167 domain-containing protein n=1 Tax=Sphingorhabdus sp. TaxID=1902408 RepID=UPI003783CE64
MKQLVGPHQSRRHQHRTAPEDGKANKAVLAILAKLLGISVSQLEITHGQTARDKRVRVLG